MKILSLFDGIACGYEALERVGIKIDKYFASEIDKHAIKIATKNHPDIIEVGDVEQLKGSDFQGIDLIIGGSPCQGFSVAGKQLNFNDPRSKLFFEFERLVKEINPKFFLLENVKMKKERQDIISERLGVEPVEICSDIFSGQRRKRLYRTNIPIEKPNPQGGGKKIKDIIQENVDEKFFLCEHEIEKVKYLKGAKKIKRNKNGFEYVYSEGAIPFPDDIEKSSRTILTSEGHISRTSHFINQNGRIRRLTPIECERLQTLPDNYTEGVSDSQRYKQLGNGRTVDVISYIFSFLSL